MGEAKRRKELGLLNSHNRIAWKKRERALEAKTKEFSVVTGGPDSTIEGDSKRGYTRVTAEMRKARLKAMKKGRAA